MEFVWPLKYLDKASRQRSSAVQIKPPQPRNSFLSAISTNPATIRIDKVALVESSWNGLGQSLLSSRANDFSGARDRLGKRSSNSARNQQMMSRAESPSPQSPFAIHQIAALIRVRNSMIGNPSIRKMVHSRRHRQSWGMCTPRHIERRNPERCCQRWTPASDERCCKGTL
jgi:hypothetical protein